MFGISDDELLELQTVILTFLIKSLFFVASKETIDTLHKCNHVISYRDIRMQNAAWARMVSQRPTPASSLRRGVVTHSSIDNNDGRQDTITGTGTTHDTNATLFQLPSKEEEFLPTIGEEQEQPLNLCDEIEDHLITTVPSFAIGKKEGPPLFPDYSEDQDTSLLDLCLKKDIAWSVAGSLQSNEDNPLMTSSAELTKCIQQYLPVIPEPPEYPVCKDYLDFLLELIKDLNLPYIFAHSDELVYSKLCHIIWKDHDLYKDIILLMGGFHQLRVMQRLLSKRFSCKEFHRWWVDAGVIAAGSADQAFEGRHYYRSMRLHKECFDALVQHRFERLTGNILLLVCIACITLKSLPIRKNLKTHRQPSSFVPRRRS